MTDTTPHPDPFTVATEALRAADQAQTDARRQLADKVTELSGKHDQLHASLDKAIKDVGKLHDRVAALENTSPPPDPTPVLPRMAGVGGFTAELAERVRAHDLAVSAMWERGTTASVPSRTTRFSYSTTDLVPSAAVASIADQRHGTDHAAWKRESGAQAWIDDCQMARVQAMMWLATGNERHWDNAYRLLFGWRSLNAMFEGKSLGYDPQGVTEHARMYWTFAGVHAIAALDIITAYHHGDVDPVATRALFAPWLRRMVPRLDQAGSGNRAAACIEMRTAIACYLGDRDLIDHCAAIVDDRLPGSIAMPGDTWEDKLPVSAATPSFPAPAGETPVKWWNESHAESDVVGQLWKVANRDVLMGTPGLCSEGGRDLSHAMAGVAGWASCVVMLANNGHPELRERHETRFAWCADRYLSALIGLDDAWPHTSEFKDGGKWVDSCWSIISEAIGRTPELVAEAQEVRPAPNTFANNRGFEHLWLDA